MKVCTTSKEFQAGWVGGPGEAGCGGLQHRQQFGGKRKGGGGSIAHKLWINLARCPDHPLTPPPPHHPATFAGRPG